MGNSVVGSLKFFFKVTIGHPNMSIAGSQRACGVPCRGTQIISYRKQEPLGVVSKGIA